MINDIINHRSAVKFLFKVLDRITFYRAQKGWTEYQLAEESRLTQSTISSWYRKDMVPSISSLEKICSAFGITLSQFFSTEENSFSLTPLQKKKFIRSIRTSYRTTTTSFNRIF